VDVRLLPDGLCNFNYRVELEAEAAPFVLRIYGHDPNACLKEAELLRLLRATTPVPEVLHVQADGCCGAGPFIVTRYVEGITFRQLRRGGDAAAVAQAAYAVGETLSAIGRHRFAARGVLGAGLAVTAPFFAGPDAIPQFIDACLADPTLRGRLDVRVRERLHALVRARAADLARLQGEACLVHRDFNNRNVLVRQERGRWVVAAVLDWECAVSGSPLFDVATFLQYERRLSPSREPYFSRGYQDGGGRLPDGWWQLARIVGLTGQCATLTQPAVPAEIVTEVAGLVRATAEQELI
jgi:aminoglycoside phosphotransferase (APT) family kinase protein